MTCQMTFDGERLQDFRAVIREAGHPVAPFLDLGDASVHVNELGLAIRAPVRRPKEEEDQAVPAHEIGQPVRLSELIEACADVRCRGADRWSKVFCRIGQRDE